MPRGSPRLKRGSLLLGLLKSAVYRESGAGLIIMRSEGRLGMSESDMLERPKHKNEIRGLNKGHETNE